jgi:hypothetical protein
MKRIWAKALKKKHHECDDCEDEHIKHLGI